MIGSSGSDLLIERIHKLAVAVCDLFHRVFSGNLIGSPVHKRVPKTCTAHREANKSRHFRSNRKPLMNFLIAFVTPQDDAPDLIATTLTSGARDFLAIRVVIEPLDFPDVRLNS